MTDELSILRIVGIKGRVSAEAVAECLGADVESVRARLEVLESGELVKATPMGYRMTVSGRARCAELVAAEHESIDKPAVSAIYESFCAHNSELKSIITDWQIRDGEPNDHSDADYDGDVLARLAELHRQVGPLLNEIDAAAPRLAHYPRRLNRAADAVAAGDLTYVSKPVLDSYHTVWFELHEDLIGLNGLTRADEAAAGRGA